MHCLLFLQCKNWQSPTKRFSARLRDQNIYAAINKTNSGIKKPAVTLANGEIEVCKPIKVQSC
jgi:hypothetical protein